MSFILNVYDSMTIHVAGDFLSIYDGDSDTSPILGNPYCGNSLPPSQISSSNHLFFHFRSDYSTNEKGFKLEYNVTSKNAQKVDSCTRLFLKLHKKDMKIKRYPLFCLPPFPPLGLTQEFFCTEKLIFI